jgi:hypothetical protein
VTFGGQAEVGVPGVLGAAATGSVGVGGFHSSTSGWSGAAFGSAGAAAYAGNSVAAFPAQTSSPAVLGASAGGGFSIFATNAESVQELSGPFSTLTANVRVGPLQFSLQLSYGNGIYEVSLSPPLLGESLGASGSKLTTDTETSNGSCP